MSLPPVQIHVLNPDEDGDDGFTDTAVFTINGERHLFLRPQSYDSAVRQVRSAMPDLTLEQVERLVREHCDDFKELDELLGAVDPAPPVDLTLPPEQPLHSVRPAGRGRKWVVAVGLVTALAGAWALGRFGGGDATNLTGSASDTTASLEGAKGAPQPFADSRFMDFSEAGKIHCNPIDDLEAECTDSDGMVMATKAATGPDSTIFTFSYGSHRVGLRIFVDVEYAATWSKQDASIELYPHLVRVGRYVLWGTDEGRVQTYAKLLRSASTAKRIPAVARPMGGVAPLPPRLAALTLGTLGMDENEVRRLLSDPEDSAGFAPPVVMAARAVLGVHEGSPPSLVDPRGGDIVALAAGIEAPRPTRTPTPSKAVAAKALGPAGVQSTPTPAAGGSSRAKSEPTSHPAPAPEPKTSPAQETPEPAQKPVQEEQEEPIPLPAVGKPAEPARPTDAEQPTTAPCGSARPVTEEPES
ncbi:hypothetical protein ACIQU6_09540 [Streptomyces sp. NPDC090442]|uniref:hypothetical protein n=1 Tax=Streptomyces sp. NPDC090442 TaxID=3365962 RepID=UPI003801C511